MAIIQFPAPAGWEFLEPWLEMFAALALAYAYVYIGKPLWRKVRPWFKAEFLAGMERALGFAAPIAA